MNSDGSNIKQLTFSNTDNTDPTFSPDGSRIAFNSERDGNSEIYIMKHDGSRQMRLTQNSYYDERAGLVTRWTEYTIYKKDRTENIIMGNKF